MSVFLYLLVGWIFLIGLYFVYRNWTTKRVICFVFNQQRSLYKQAVKPDIDGLLHIKGRTYHYNHQMVFYTNGFLLKEPAPALLFAEENENAIDPFTKRPKAAFSATELSEILNDKTVRDFVQAQSGISPKQIVTAILIMGLVVSGVSLIGTMMLMGQINPGFLDGLTQNTSAAGR